MLSAWGTTEKYQKPNAVVDLSWVLNAVYAQKGALGDAGDKGSS